MYRTSISCRGNNLKADPNPENTGEGRCRYNVDPPSQTVGHHCAGIGFRITLAGVTRIDDVASSKDRKGKGGVYII